MDVDIVQLVVVVIVVPFFTIPVLSPNNGGGRIYLILLEIAVTPNLHLVRLS